MGGKRDDGLANHGAHTHSASYQFGVITVASGSRTSR